MICFIQKYTYNKILESIEIVMTKEINFLNDKHLKIYSTTYIYRKYLSFIGKMKKNHKSINIYKAEMHTHFCNR